MKTDIFGKPLDEIYKKKLFLFDMDGTLYLGMNIFPRINELLAFVKSSGACYAFVTNNASRSVADYIKKLHKLGIEASPCEFQTSTQATRFVLHKKHENDLIYVQGTSSFIKELIDDGFNVTTELKEGIKAVVVGYDVELTHKKMLTTCEVLTKFDVPYYATNPDWACPTEYGLVPDCGSMCFGYEKATGKKPCYIGKPDPLMIELALEKCGIKKEDAIVIGDRIYTDVASGVNAGVDTIFVLSGEGKLKDIEESGIKPTFVLNRITDILD